MTVETRRRVARRCAGVESYGPPACGSAVVQSCSRLWCRYVCTALAPDAFGWCPEFDCTDYTTTRSCAATCGNAWCSPCAVGGALHGQPGGCCSRPCSSYQTPGWIWEDL